MLITLIYSITCGNSVRAVSSSALIVFSLLCLTACDIPNIAGLSSNNPRLVIEAPSTHSPANLATVRIDFRDDVIDSYSGTIQVFSEPAHDSENPPVGIDITTNVPNLPAVAPGVEFVLNGVATQSVQIVVTLNVTHNNGDTEIFTATEYVYAEHPIINTMADLVAANSPADPGLKACLQDYIDGGIYPADMLLIDVEILRCPNRGITDISAVEFFRNLKELDVQQNLLEEGYVVFDADRRFIDYHSRALEPLGLLRQLTHLNISANCVASAKDLRWHEKLKIFKANANCFTNLTWLYEVQSLEEVYLEHNHIGSGFLDNGDVEQKANAWADAPNNNNQFENYGALQGVCVLSNLKVLDLTAQDGGRQYWLPNDDPFNMHTRSWGINAIPYWKGAGCGGTFCGMGSLNSNLKDDLEDRLALDNGAWHRRLSMRDLKMFKYCKRDNYNQVLESLQVLELDSNLLNRKHESDSGIGVDYKTLADVLSWNVGLTDLKLEYNPSCGWSATNCKGLKKRDIRNLAFCLYKHGNISTVLSDAQGEVYGLNITALTLIDTSPISWTESLTLPNFAATAAGVGAARYGCDIISTP